MLDLAEEGHFNLRKSLFRSHLSLIPSENHQRTSRHQFQRSEMGIYISKMLLDLALVLVKSGVVIKS